MPRPGPENRKTLSASVNGANSDDEYGPASKRKKTAGMPIRRSARSTTSSAKYVEPSEYEFDKDEDNEEDTHWRGG